MPFTLDQLQAGIDYWQETNWPKDFHNQFYIELNEHNQQGLFTDIWWSGILDRLIRWKAIRPRPAAFIAQRYFERQEMLIDLWKPVSNLPPDILISERNNHNDIIDIIAPIANRVREIKDVRSPVFTSKFLHFIYPQIFPVIDRRAMGLPCEDYIEYWKSVRNEWQKTPEVVRHNLIDCLRTQIGNNVFENYPFYTKIAELCITGANKGHGGGVRSCLLLFG